MLTNTPCLYVDAPTLPPCWTDASQTSRATISGGSCFSVLTVRLSDICVFVADSLHWTGHYKLWLSGVHHREVRAFNLMYKRREDEAIVGVLIDFDLAIPHGSQSTNTKRTGTMLFMALDMLENIIYNTNQVHLYQHDAESFLWLAMWVCGTYEDGEQRWNASFETWAQGDVKHCADSKYGFMARNEQDIWSKSHQARAGLLWKICSQLDDDAIDRRRQRRADGGVVQPEEPECPDTHYNRIDSKLFSTLRKELGE